MNIGEISKPSVDRTQVDKKLKVNQADPVLKTQATSDRVKLSDESQKRYQEEYKKNKNSTSQRTNESVEDIDSQRKTPSIDLTA